MGPTRGPDAVTPHKRVPADDDAEHLLVRTAECVDGQVELELVCEPVFDYGKTVATWALTDENGHAADASSAELTLRLTTDMALGIEGSRARARHMLRAGDRVFCSLSWADGLTAPETSTTPRRASTPPCSSGGTGWTERGSPTTDIATRSSAPH